MEWYFKKKICVSGSTKNKYGHGKQRRKWDFYYERGLMADLWKLEYLLVNVALTFIQLYY